MLGPSSYGWNHKQRTCGLFLVSRGGLLSDFPGPATPLPAYGGFPRAISLAPHAAASTSHHSAVVDKGSIVRGCGEQFGETTLRTADSATVVDKGAVAYVATEQARHALFGLTRANALLRLKPQEKLVAGSEVEVLLLD